MDKCPAEVVTIIFDYACASDLGNTACRLGLVSKYFRTIAEPLEFRTLMIAGPDQLKRALVKLNSMQEAQHSGAVMGGVGVNIKHLFICDLKIKHALAVEMVSSRRAAPLRPQRSRFWQGSEGREANSYYRDHSEEFWESSSALVRIASTTLITLTALQGAPLSKGDTFSVISRVHLPRLKALTLEQIINSSGFGAGTDLFIPPIAPSLQRIHLMARVYQDAGTNGSNLSPARLHPLLEDVHSRFGGLTHLIIRGLSIKDVETLIKVVCGTADDAAPSVSACVANCQLPGKLISAVPQLDVHPMFPHGFGSTAHKQRVRAFINNVKALHIDGLEVYPLTRLYSEYL
ncbi:hypothetical protein M0805_009745 [Coniferiporia weirii]|nr:hypothetical protein M0805_009745 [Coniferiporia weirii]